MVKQIYLPELQLNTTNTSDNEASFLDLHLSISDCFISSKINDKRDEFDFGTVNLSFMDGDVQRPSSYGVYISQLIRFARVCSHVVDINDRNKCYTAKLLIGIISLERFFPSSIADTMNWFQKVNVGLKSLLH